MKFIKREAFFPEEAAAPEGEAEKRAASKKNSRRAASEDAKKRLKKSPEWKLSDIEIVLAARQSPARGREIASALIDDAEAAGPGAVLALMARARRLVKLGYPAMTDDFGRLGEIFLADKSMKPAPEAMRFFAETLMAGAAIGWEADELADELEARESALGEPEGCDSMRFRILARAQELGTPGFVGMPSAGALLLKSELCASTTSTGRCKGDPQKAVWDLRVAAETIDELLRTPELAPGSAKAKSAAFAAGRIALMRLHQSAMAEARAAQCFWLAERPKDACRAAAAAIEAGLSKTFTNDVSKRFIEAGRLKLRSSAAALDEAPEERREGLERAAGAIFCMMSVPAKFPAAERRELEAAAAEPFPMKGEAADQLFWLAAAAGSTEIMKAEENAPGAAYAVMTEAEAMARGERPALSREIFGLAPKAIASLAPAAALAAALAAMQYGERAIKIQTLFPKGALGPELLAALEGERARAAAFAEAVFASARLRRAFGRLPAFRLLGVFTASGASPAEISKDPQGFLEAHGRAAEAALSALEAVTDATDERLAKKILATAMTAASVFSTLRTRIAFAQWRRQNAEKWSPASLENVVRAVDGQPLGAKGRLAMRQKAAEAWALLDRLLKAAKGRLAAVADWGAWLDGASEALAGFALSSEADPLALEAAEKTFAVMRASAETHGSTASWEKAGASALLVFKRYEAAAGTSWEAAKRLEAAGRVDAGFLRRSALAWEFWRRQDWIQCWKRRALARAAKDLAPIGVAEALLSAKGGGPILALVKPVASFARSDWRLLLSWASQPRPGCMAVEAAMPVETDIELPWWTAEAADAAATLPGVLFEESADWLSRADAEAEQMASLGSELADLLGELLGKEASDWMKGGAAGFNAPKRALAPIIEAAAAIGTKALPSAVQRTLGSKLAKDAWLAEAVSLGARALAGGALPDGEAFALMSFAAMRSRPETEAESSALGGFWGLLFARPGLVPDAFAPAEVPEPVDNRKPFPESDGRNPFVKWEAEGRGAEAMMPAYALQPMGVLRRTKAPVAVIAPVYAEEADWIREHGLAEFLRRAQAQGVSLFPARRSRSNVCSSSAAEGAEKDEPAEG